MSIERNIVLDGPNGRPILADVFLPEENKSDNILVFCHGYKGFKDWGPWNLMSEIFMRSGITAVKFNFSFNGGTIEQPIDFPDLEAFGMNNYSKELDDLDVVLDFIESDKRFKNKSGRRQIILMGHSRGGGIVSLKAAADARIDVLITLAGVSDFESRFNIGSEEFNNWKKDGIKYILNGRTKQQMPHYFQFYEDFARNRDKLNIQKALKNFSKPHLIIHGTADNAVDINEAFNMKSWNPDARLEVIEDADHVLGSCHPWKENHLSPDLEKAVELCLSFIENYAS